MTLASVQHATTISPIIYRMGVMNQQLIHRSLNLGLVAEAKQLQHIDRHLTWLLHKSTNFDFVAEVSQGRTLLVGEGNLSFTRSLAAMSGITPSRLIASTFENKEELSSDAIANTEASRHMGVTVHQSGLPEPNSDTSSSRPSDICSRRRYDYHADNLPS